MSRSNSNNTNVFCVQQTQASSIVIPGISDIVASYKCLLLDQFGVIHDGQRVYPGALEALQKAHELGIKSVIISNSSRRASTTLRKLKSLDINLDFISDVVTSGELAFKALPEFTSNHPNARVLHFNWGSSSRSAVSIFEHGFKNVAPCTREFLGVSVPDPKDVDVIVAHGTTGISCPDGTVKDIGWDLATELLKQVVETRPDVPFFVANPDIVTVDGPNLRTMPGALAKVFEENGGRTVHRLGKPDPVAYEEALRLAGVNRKDVLAVGDSMGHDVLGAADAGIQSLYVCFPLFFFFSFSFLFYNFFVF